MEKMKNLSIRKAIIFYISLSLVISFFVGAGISHAAVVKQRQIWWKYINEKEYSKITETGYFNEVPRPANSSMTKMDECISELCDFLQTYGILVVSVIGTIVAVALFYRNKMKLPLEKLQEASEMMARNDLDFHLDYSNQDELGRLCMEFEKMRGALEKNNRVMWRMVEDEKALRSAIAHDIRTPLAILKGYQEILLEFFPENELDKKKTMEMLQAGMDQIERIDNFVETMRKLSGLENREVQVQETDMGALGEKIEKSVQAIRKNSGKKTMVHLGTFTGKMLLDMELVLEVTENLVSNALRYAKQKVDITISAVNQELEITVQDDGSGFTANTEQVTRAYYHTNSRDDVQHFGMGMYLSRVYCEKHGGRLLAGNQTQGGAVVKASFKI